MVKPFGQRYNIKIYKCKFLTNYFNQMVKIIISLQDINLIVDKKIFLVLENSLRKIAICHAEYKKRAPKSPFFNKILYGILLLSYITGQCSIDAGF